MFNGLWGIIERNLWRMEEKIKKLKEKLNYIGTRDLLGMIGIHFITFADNAEDVAEQADIFNKTKLMSPQKQYMYLAGLLMSTEDKSDGSIMKSEIFDELESDVQEITQEYIRTFLNIDYKAEPNNAKRNLVSMEAFTSYFDTGILRYPEQTIELIRELYTDFDLHLEEMTGLVLEDFISFYQLICDTFEETMNASKYTMESIKKQLNSFNPFAVDIEKEYERFLAFAQGAASINLQNTMDNLNTIKSASVMEMFGKKKGEKLLDIFGLYRAETDFLYYNGKNPFAEKPLCWIDKETLFIVHPQFLLNAIYNYITDTLENPKNPFADKYKKSKADIVENLFIKLLEKIFGEEAKYHTSVCEERGTKEHDILIEFKDYILIAEVKASKVREPFFNPEKGYKRVRDHFKSDSGIGGAYEQAIILKKFMEVKNDAILFENKNKKFVVENISKKKILPIVLTLNQFGGLAVNTSMILEKEDNQPYPWVCNWHDLENIIEILQYLNKKPDDFMDYIVWRIANHTNVLSSDELDVIEGYFVNSYVKEKKGAIYFPPNGPSLIDKIYFERHGIPYEFPLKKSPVYKKKKIGRNAPCPCNSGKKFKKCCIGKGIYD